jgi:hypothetical protein
MKRKLFASVLVAIGVLAGVGSSGASASSGPLIDLCATAPADRTITLGAGVPVAEADTLAGVAYNDPSRPCRQFIVDVQVPASSSAPGYLPAFQLTAFTDRQYYHQGGWNVCPDGDWTSVYRKEAKPTVITRLGTVYLRGTWVDGQCVMASLPSNDPWPAVLYPPAKGTVTYRIVTKAFEQVSGCHGYCTDGTYWLHRWVRAAHLRAS